MAKECLGSSLTCLLLDKPESQQQALNAPFKSRVAHARRHKSFGGSIGASTLWHEIITEKYPWAWFFFKGIWCTLNLRDRSAVSRNCAWNSEFVGDRFLSSASTGKNCALSMGCPDCSPALDKIRAPMGPEILSSIGAGAWRKAPMAFPDSSSVLYKFQSANLGDEHHFEIFDREWYFCARG